MTVLLNGTYVAELDYGPSTAAAAAAALERLPGNGSSTADAMALALMRRSEPGRRHLIVAFTQGNDYFSMTEFSALPKIAAWTDGVLHVVLVPQFPGGYGRGRPRFHASAEALATTAEVTGGGRHELNGGLARTLAAIVEEFRTSYVLTYSPRGVEGGGWHELGVTLTIPSAKDYTVRARRGYFADHRFPK